MSSVANSHNRVESTVCVTIPEASASRSKMAKKGWKCWAKVLSHVGTPANDGYAYEGTFVSPGTTIEARPGDVILHVDQSDTADIMVAMVNAGGKGFLWSIDSADSEGRKWCGPLGRPARKLLAMPVEERIRHVAGEIAANRPASRSDEVQAYYEALARGPQAGSEPAGEPDARSEAIATIKRLMGEHGITLTEIEAAVPAAPVATPNS